MIELSAPKGWYEASRVQAEGKVLCGVDKPCSRTGCGYDNHASDGEEPGRRRGPAGRVRLVYYPRMPKFTRSRPP